MVACSHRSKGRGHVHGLTIRECHVKLFVNKPREKNRNSHRTNKPSCRPGEKMTSAAELGLAENESQRDPSPTQTSDSKLHVPIAPAPLLCISFTCALWYLAWSCTMTKIL